MRMVIKGADFSNVSIGKVVKDLSFKIDKNNYSEEFTNPPSEFPSYPVSAGTGYNGPTTFYSASNGDAQYTVVTNNTNRFTTDFIEVIPGMNIHVLWITGNSSCPGIVCFDENKDPLVPANTTNAAWTPQAKEVNFTVPEGAKYIMIQIEQLYEAFVAEGTMPE